MATQKKVSRRRFLQLSGISGAALALGYYLHEANAEPEVIKTVIAQQAGIALNAFISIDPSGLVTIVNHRAEMGQGAFQAIPQIIAEELEVDLNKVKIVQAPTNPEKYGLQLTGGSSTIVRNYQPLGKLGATAREMLIKAAANQWKVSAVDCYAQNGHVIHRPTGRKFHYGELVKDAAKLTPPPNITLKRREDYKLLRKPLPRQDIPLKTNGTAIFGLDIKLPGMLYAVVERNSRFLGKVQHFDDTETKKIPGVRHVLAVKMNVFATMREGIAVVADTLWAAMQGRKVLKVTWDDSGFEHYNTEQLYDTMKQDLKTKEGLLFKAKGNYSAAFTKSEKKLEVVYETPYQSHSCMEPMNCVAHVHEGICEVWGSFQGPDFVQSQLSTQLGMPKEKIKVNMTFLGGGFGRRAFMDYPHEAAVISQAIKAPVQVVWTREDDMTQGPFRPGFVYQCKGGVGTTGNLNSLEMKAAGQNMDHQWAGADKTAYNNYITEGMLDRYFESLPNYRFLDIPLDAPIPVMWWRSVHASTNGFALESFWDELALLAGKDPLDFRRQYLEGERYEQLFAQLEKVSNWKNRPKQGGFGVAVTQCFGSTVGEVVKVSKKPGDGGIKIDKVWAIIDCGSYVNPDIVRAQVEGSIVMALGAAVKHETLFENGRAVQGNFDTYAMPRLTDTPEIEVYIIENEEKPGGAGEPALPPFAPALCNAIFDLTGQRIRKLPFDLDKF